MKLGYKRRVKGKTGTIQVASLVLKVVHCCNLCGTVAVTLRGGGGGSGLSVIMTLTVGKTICESPLTHLRLSCSVINLFTSCRVCNLYIIIIIMGWPARLGGGGGGGGEGCQLGSYQPNKSLYNSACVCMCVCCTSH